MHYTINRQSKRLQSIAEREVVVQRQHSGLRAPTYSLVAAKRGFIALTKFDAMPTQKVTFSRRNVFKRDKMTCQYCGKQPGSEELTIGHVVPRAQGGQSTWTNCVLACIDCYSKKADRTPAQAHMKLRKEPVRPAWKPIYADRMNRVKSWSKFISEAYWAVELED